MNRWLETTLGEACELYQPKTISSAELVADGEYPVYGANGVIGKFDKFNHAEPQLLITCRGATCGSVNVSQPNSWINGNAMVVKPRDISVDLVYLKHLFQGGLDLTAVITGAAQPQITRQSLAPLKVRFPPIHEQRRIAAILDQADALRAKRREALAQLDSLTQSIFIEMFGDPVINPKGWPLRKLGNVGPLDRGVSKHRPRNASELLGGEYPLVQTGEVANCDGYIRNHNSSYSELGLRQSKLWPAGTLCITIAANIAKTGILTFDACFPDSVVGFSAEKQETVEYVRVWLSFLQRALEAAAPESAQKNINLAILRDLDIPLPPMPLQKNFADRLSATENLKITHRASLVKLDTLFASLQHRAFRGEL